MYMFYNDSTIRFNSEKGFGESYYLICPVCWNSSIRETRWEDGSIESGECVTCKRMEEMMDLERIKGPD